MTNQKTYGPKVLGVVWIWASRNGLPKYQYNLDLSGVVDLVPKMKAVNGFRKKYRSCLFLKSLPKDRFFEHICLTYMIYHDWYTQIKQYILFSKLSRVDKTQFHSTFGISGFPKMVGFPNKPMGFPSKNWSFWGPFWGYHHLRKPPYPFTSHGPPKLVGWVNPQVMKVDNHIHLAAAMTPRMLLAFLGIEIMKHPCFEKGFSWANKSSIFPFWDKDLLFLD